MSGKACPLGRTGMALTLPRSSRRRRTWRQQELSDLQSLEVQSREEEAKRHTVQLKPAFLDWSKRSGRMCLGILAMAPIFSLVHSDQTDGVKNHCQRDERGRNRAVS